MEAILDKIDREYKNLPPSQQIVAQYIFRNPEDAILLNSNQIANKVKVSEATVTRFIAALGFSGFSEFRRKMGQLLIKNLTTAKRLSESVDAFEGRNSVFAEILKGDIENIHALTRNVSEATFTHAVETLCSARAIYVLGLRGSYALAFYFVSYLRFFLPSVKTIKPDVGDIPEQIHDIGENDVLVTISFKRYSREVVEITEKIKLRGTRLIAITDNQFSPISQMADLSLFAATEVPSYIDSFSAPMSLIGALVAAIAIGVKEKALPELNKLESEFEEFETFFNEYRRRR